MSDQHGFSLLETLAALAIGALLVVMLLEVHAVLQQRVRYEAARWQAFERVRVASLLLEDELRLAGFWGGMPADRGIAMPAAVTGGGGRVVCQGSPCAMPGEDRLAPAGGRESALIVRFARAGGDPMAAGLPLLFAEAQGAQWHHYAAGYYLDGDGPGLYLRIAGRSLAQELVRGITGLRCEYGLGGDADGHSFAFVAAEQVSDWRRAVAVRCTLRAVSDPLGFAGGGIDQVEVERSLLVVLRNPLDQHLAASRLEALSIFEDRE